MPQHDSWNCSAQKRLYCASRACPGSVFRRSAQFHKRRSLDTAVAIFQQESDASTSREQQAPPWCSHWRRLVSDRQSIVCPSASEYGQMRQLQASVVFGLPSVSDSAGLWFRASQHEFGERLPPCLHLEKHCRHLASCLFWKVASLVLLLGLTCAGSSASPPPATPIAVHGKVTYASSSFDL
jgi:hypothetical protein